MTIRVVGAGLPRTGTTSLCAALPRLLRGTCYHMRELGEHLDHAAVWRDAFAGASPDWDTFLAGYTAGVDWPFSWLWRELSEEYPDALVLLSQRDDPAQWYRSMSNTVLYVARNLRDGVTPNRSWTLDATPEQRAAMYDVTKATFGVFPEPEDQAAVEQVYVRHLAEVRATIPAHRLLEWRPSAGWEPLCAALDVPVPDEPFPHRNSTADMQAWNPELRGQG